MYQTFFTTAIWKWTLQDIKILILAHWKTVFEMPVYENWSIILPFSFFPIKCDYSQYKNEHSVNPLYNLQSFYWTEILVWMCYLVQMKRVKHKTNKSNQLILVTFQHTVESTPRSFPYLFLLLWRWKKMKVSVCWSCVKMLNIIV